MCPKEVVHKQTGSWNNARSAIVSFPYIGELMATCQPSQHDSIRLVDILYIHVHINTALPSNAAVDIRLVTCTCMYSVHVVYTTFQIVGASLSEPK